LYHPLVVGVSVYPPHLARLNSAVRHTVLRAAFPRTAKSVTRWCRAPSCPAAPCVRSLLQLTCRPATARVVHGGRSAPVLSGTLASPIEAFGGTLDGSVHRFDLNTGVASEIGAHTEAVRCLSYSTGANAVVSSSWDKTLRIWDPRSPQGGLVTSLPDKAFTMDTHGNRVIVGTAGRHVWWVPLLRTHVCVWRK
jgi:hypothetical protein